MGERANEVEATDRRGPSAAPAAGAAGVIEIGGIPLNGLDLATAMRMVAEACAGRRAMQVCTVNLQYLSLARKDGRFREVVRRAGLTVIDGRPVLWLARRRSRSARPMQVTGHAMVDGCTALAARQGYRLLLLGGGPGIADAAAAALRTRHPGADIVTLAGGDFAADGRAADEAALMAAIDRLQPRMMFVALGAPKQDLWIARHLDRMPPAVAIGVGSVFDTLAGRMPAIPRWVSVAGLEWLARTAMQPRRYARRHLLESAPTLFRLLFPARRGGAARDWTPDPRRPDTLS